MASEKKDPTISALEAVHNALRPLEAAQRQRVLASVYALLEIGESPISVPPPAPPGSRSQPPVSSRPSAPTAVRPIAIRELIQEKKPHTHPEFITLFAYYREKHQNIPTFSRADLEAYYATSHEPPPRNFDRDFVKALRRGWLHEDGDNSYITSKGLEVVESNFSDASGSSISTAKGSRKKKKKKKRARNTAR